VAPRIGGKFPEVTEKVGKGPPRYADEDE